MTAQSTTKTKLDKLYAGLSEIERVRMLAKLSRAHDRVEMDRLRNATPPEQADAYNRALGLLRVLNGQVTDWIALFQIAMERDRLQLQYAISEAARHSLAVLSLSNLWELVPYPVTESEYRAIVKVDRIELRSLNEYMESLWDVGTLRPELREIVQEYRDADEPSDAEKEAFWKGYEARIAATVRTAIKRGELPKPRRAPKNAVNEEPGDIWIPAGALTDWAEGTTEETYKPLDPGSCVPILGEVLKGDVAEWEIRSDSEADAVKARREQMRHTFLDLRAIPRVERKRAPSLDPPLTLNDREGDRKLAEELSRAWSAHHGLALFALDVAQTHATHRAQLEDITAAIEIVCRDDFGGEAPLWAEVRERLEAAQAEAKRFDETWGSANDTMQSVLREAAGLDAYPRDSWNPEIKTLDIPPVPLPTGEHDLESTLRLIQDWSR